MLIDKEHKIGAARRKNRFLPIVKIGKDMTIYDVEFEKIEDAIKYANSMYWQKLKFDDKDQWSCGRCHG